MAWLQTFPEAAAQARAMSEQQIRQYEQALAAYAQADAAGLLSPVYRHEAEALYQDYVKLVEEFRRTFGE
jgi:hypothetical protein